MLTVNTFYPFIFPYILCLTHTFLKSCQCNGFPMYCICPYASNKPSMTFITSPKLESEWFQYFGTISPNMEIRPKTPQFLTNFDFYSFWWIVLVHTLPTSPGTTPISSIYTKLCPNYQILPFWATRVSLLPKIWKIPPLEGPHGGLPPPLFCPFLAIFMFFLAISAKCPPT